MVNFSEIQRKKMPTEVWQFIAEQKVIFQSSGESPVRSKRNVHTAWKYKIYSA